MAPLLVILRYLLLNPITGAPKARSPRRIALHRHANTSSRDAFTETERRGVQALAAIYAVRMLGLFMVLPVMALAAREYTGYTAALVGIAIGIYGLTQALFQIPFGLASDRFGRKRVIMLGLLLFAVGSVVAAYADSMLGLIVGRALQGAGAVAAAVMALAADLTRDSQRTKAMASIGASIGLAFGAAMVLGPLITEWGGLSAVFGLSAALAVLGIGVLLYAVPNPEPIRASAEIQPVRHDLVAVLKHAELLRLDAGIFVLHAIITATFVVLPLEVERVLGIGIASHAGVYLGVMLVSVLLMVPFIIMGERSGKQRSIFLTAIAVVGVGALALSFATRGPVEFLIALIVFFTAFNLLEASLPSLVSKIAPAGTRGTALGIYSTAQFAGAFVGGVGAGWLQTLWGPEAIHASAAVLALVWLGVAWPMRPPASLTRRVLDVGQMSREEANDLGERLAAVPGVTEAVVVADEGAAYLKVDRSGLDESALRNVQPLRMGA